MYFRPLLWPTIISLPALIILIMLGSWQVQRLAEKTTLIADFTARTAAVPIPLPLGEIDLGTLQFQRVFARGKFRHDQEIYLNGRTYEGNAGFHVVTPFVTLEGTEILVNRGWVPESYREPSSRPFSIKAEETVLNGIIRRPQRKGYFVPENEPQRGFWFTMKPDEIAAYLQADDMIVGYYVDAVREGEVITLPIAAVIRIDVPNAHLNYALTWYGLALALLGVYGAYHVSHGRLLFGRAAKAKNKH